MRLEEKQNDGKPEYLGFDNYYITRRILEYCQITDQPVADFIEGLDEQEANEFI